jgi:hypothetical protein
MTDIPTPANFPELLRSFEKLSEMSCELLAENLELKELVYAMSRGDEMTEEQTELVMMVRLDYEAQKIAKKRRGNGG